MSVDARPADGYAGDITAQQAWDLLAADDDAVLVDVRTDAEWTYVGVPDLTELNRDVVLDEWVHQGGVPNPAFVDALREAVGDGPADRPLIFLCRSGQRSIGAARAATAAGLGTSYNILEGFEGGIADGHRGQAGWKATGLPWKQS